MLFKWVKILLIACLAPVAVNQMLLYLDITSVGFGVGINFALMFWFSIFELQLKPALNGRYFDAHL